MEVLKNKILLKKYKIIKRIGKGSFGSVYLGKNIQQNNYVAVKLESKEQNDTILEREAYILYSLKGFGIPELISYGQNSQYNILVQELLGKSIDKIFFEKNKKFSIKDCCMIGLQILDRLEYIHSKFIIHRDIKGDNFLLGIKNKTIIYLIDFGLAKQYKSRKTGKHVKYSINKKWSGTSRFASANTLRGVEPSRRDDLESFCYLLLYLMRGSLPWDHINEESEINEILIIYKMKQYMTPEMLFSELPSQMIKFYKYCKTLEFDQKPNYKYLRSLLISILKHMGEQNDLHFSWIINITLNKSKSGFIFNKSKEKDTPNKKVILKSMNTNNKDQQIKENENIKRKNIINLDFSTGKIYKRGNLNNEIKNNILGHCNIIKRRYIKSQTPELRRIITDENKSKNNKIIPKKSIVIDLTNYIEAKKAHEIKSYKNKLFNYRETERKIKFFNQNQSDNYHCNITEQGKNNNKLIEKKLISSPRNLFLSKIIRNNNMNEISSSTFISNNINNLSYIKNASTNTNINNEDKHKIKINSYIFKGKAISPISNNNTKKRIIKNSKSNIYEESKNEYILSSKRKINYSNSIGNSIKSRLKNLEIIDNNKNLNNNKKIIKELTIIIPRRQKTTYTLDNYQFQNYKRYLDSSLNNDNSKMKYNYKFIYNKKYFPLSPNNIKRKKTDTDLPTFSYKRKFLLENNNIKKIMLNKYNVKKDKIAEDKKLNYLVKNNYIKEQIYSSYNNIQFRKKKISNNFKNLKLMSNAYVNKIY